MTCENLGLGPQLLELERGGQHTETLAVPFDRIGHHEPVGKPGDGRFHVNNRHAAGLPDVGPCRDEPQSGQHGIVGERAVHGAKHRHGVVRVRAVRDEVCDVVRLSPRPAFETGLEQFAVLGNRDPGDFVRQPSILGVEHRQHDDRHCRA